MIQETIAELEAKIHNAGGVNPERKAELLRLLTTLRNEIGGLSQTQPEEAQSIAGFATVSTHEAIRTSKDPELIKLSLEGFSSSVSQFENSHPALVRIVNRMCEILANLGI